MTDGRCYLYKCSKSRNLEVKVQGAEWMDCPFNQWINVCISFIKKYFINEVN
jgi:hypothetical protein